ncbi:hypothetical protein BJ166DRAFT_498680 [Pestalotiopsis sp. NC0098]|nr:hypothetical protein BJ166DRAFT_498680 [Pestalotiopsis sp. NC0098]
MAPTMTMPMGALSPSMTDMNPMSTGAVSTASTNMDDMNDGSMAPMAMTFFLSANTPLFFPSWTPSDPWGHAATCIFLVLLAVIMRILLASKPILEAAVWKPRRAADAHEILPLDDCCDEDPDRMKEQQYLIQSREEVDCGALQRVLREVKSRCHGPRLSSRGLRALFEMTLAVIGYLLLFYFRRCRDILGHAFAGRLGDD